MTDLMSSVGVVDDVGGALNNLGDRLHDLEQTVYSADIMGKPAGTDTFPNGIFIGPTGPTQQPVNLTISPLPSTPTITTSTYFSDVFIDVSWVGPADSSATYYDVEIAKKTGSSYSLTQVQKVNGTSARFSGLESGTTYGIRVTPRNKLGMPGTSSPATGFTDIVAATDSSAPAALTGLTVTTGVRSILVSWTGSSDVDVANGKGQYEVQISTNSGFTAIFKDWYTADTIAGVTDAITGVQYWVRVRAFDQSGNAGPWTAVASVTVGTITGADLDPATVRNTQTEYLITAGTGNPSTPAADYSTAGGQLSIQGTGLTRVTDVAAFDGTKILYDGSWTGTGTVPQTGGPYYRGLKPGKYKAVFFVRSGQASVAPSTVILHLQVTTAAGTTYIPESGTWKDVLASDLGVDPNATTGTCDSQWHAVSIPFTIKTNMSGVAGFELYAGTSVSSQAYQWGFSHVIVVPFAALVQDEIVSKYIASSAVVAGKVAAQAITTETLVVGLTQPANAIPNGNFEDLSLADPTRFATWVYDWQVVGTAAAYAIATGSSAIGGSKSFQVTNAGNHVAGLAIASQAFPVVPGDVWYVSAKVQANVTLSHGRYFRVYWGTNPTFGRTDAGVTLTEITTADGPWNTTPTLVEGQVTVPAGVTWARVALLTWTDTNVVYTGTWDDVTARRVVNSVQIGNGAVLATNVGANQIDSSHINTVGLDAGVVKFGTMSGGRIATNSASIEILTSSTLTTTTLTIGSGGQIAIGSPPTTGLYINDQGIRLYSGGVVQVSLDVGGTASFTGAISGSTITGSTITSGPATLDSTGLWIKGASQGGGGGYSPTTPANTLRFRDTTGGIDRWWLSDDQSDIYPHLLISPNNAVGRGELEFGMSIMSWYSPDFYRIFNFNIGASIDGGTTTTGKYQITGRGGAPAFSLVDSGASFTEAGFHPSYPGSGNSVFNCVQGATFNGWTDCAALSFITESSHQFKRNLRKVKAQTVHQQFRGLQAYKFQHTHRDDVFKEETPEVRRMRHKANDLWKYGWVAEEVHDLFPEAVHYDHDVPYGLDYSSLLPVAVDQLQYAFERIEALESEIIALRMKV